MADKKKSTDVRVEDIFDEVNPVGPFKCRHCGVKNEYTYDKASWMYGSPLVVCSHCKGEQLVLGRLEPALYAKFRVISNYKAIVVVFVVSLIFHVAFTVTLMHLIFQGPDFNDALIMIWCVSWEIPVVALFMLVDTWKAEKKRGAITILNKSKARMKNLDYVRMLLDLGHEVPRKLWPKDYKPKPIFKKQKPRFVKE